MQSSNKPTKIQVPFANGAGAGYKNSIPVASQISTSPGAASFTDGFPPATMMPLASGGVPPSGPDMNGILNAITAIQQWQSAGGKFAYDAAFATAIGGYPKGAILVNATNDGYWRNTAEGNMTNPDATDGSAAGWVLAMSYPYRKNVLINGNFDVWQRGVTPLSITGNTGSGIAFTADRWSVNYSTSAAASALTGQQTAFTPGQTALPNEPKYYLASNFSGDTVSPASGDYVFVSQAIEGVRTLAGKTVMLSFWAAGSGNLKIPVSMVQSFGTGGSPSSGVFIPAQTVTLNAPNTWQKFSLTCTIPSISGKTIGTNGDDTLLLRFWQMAGTGVGAANQLGQAGAFVGCTNFSLAQVQLEVGSVATDFEYQSYGRVLRDCLRYYERQNFPSANEIAIASIVSSTLAYAVARYQPKRANPTVTFSSQTGFALSGASTIPATGISATGVLIDRALLNVAISGGTASQATLLESYNGAQYIEFNAELS